MSHFFLDPDGEARFRAVSHHTLNVSHINRKCRCGKSTSVKALTQYGECVACQKETKKRNQAPTFAFTTGSTDYLAPGTGDRRFWLAPSVWTKARKA